ncbi:MAG: SDR family oxidoreductase [Microbacterium gubbeenense]|uniref:SDR family oxidoreductase n=2 Tax=Microbacteriaceae TaxID=85023 RepID=A0A9D1YXW1_9MICO|nr:SDR family oxidoreductase [Microbacterium gubbeenense]HIY65936.1 SDR family oxidoreductase [Candidatus Agrococcus pullicola]HJA03856.1 SDR family oxidoreductase [Candidatus Microbacterium stercoravium]
MTRVLVTGATGYVGGRLVPQLLDAGYDVSVCVRSPWKLGDVPWRSRVRVFKADLSDAVATRRAMTGVDVAFYLVHAMSAGRDFENAEAQAARTFAEAAEAASVGRLVYLGGLHPHGGRLSAHLASRAAVGQTFLDCSVPALVFQAGIVIGSGSASFEMIRHLTEVLPYMPAPRWVRNHVQPIAIRDVLRYLVQAVAVEEDLNRAFDIGGPDVLRYGQMMNGYAVEAGLPQRRIAALPVLTPWLASQWVSLVSPIPRQLAVPIIASLQNDCVVSERDIDQYIAPPEDGLIAYRTAVRLALKREAEGQVETSWQSATVPGAPSDPLPSDPDWAGHTVFTDLRERDSTAPAGAVWDVIEAIGGVRGWHSFPLAWAARGWIDKLVGGVGMRRGRRHPYRVNSGDVIDVWRVESIERGRTLRLRAEMRMPGRGWLELEVEPNESGSRYRQRAVYFPKGLSGRLYWLVLLPFHGILFNGMARSILRDAERSAADAS